MLGSGSEARIIFSAKNLIIYILAVGMAVQNAIPKVLEK